MIRIIIGVIIGILNILLYALVTGAFIYILIDYKNSNIENNYPVWEYQFGWYIIVIICCLIMTLVSLLLIVGILKQNYLLICPWLCLSMAGILLNIIGLFILEDSNVVINIMGIVLQFLIWYLIFTLYKDIIHQNQTRFVLNQENEYVPNNPLNTNNDNPLS